MTQNDFLQPLLSLPPFIVYLIILIWGFGSLLLVAIKTRTIKTHLVKNPGFMIGDFFLLPAAGGLIAFFYQSVTNPVTETTSSVWTLLTLSISLVISVGTGVRFKLFKKYLILGLPHAVFHLFFTYLCLTFVSKGFWQLTYGESSLVLWVVWLSVVSAIISHLVLGVIWPKKLPFEQEII